MSTWVDLYSVLFAVYGPGFDSGYDESFRSLQALFAETILQRTLTSEPSDVVLSFLVDIGEEEPNGSWLRIPMPAFEGENPVIPEDRGVLAPDN